MLVKLKLKLLFEEETMGGVSFRLPGDETALAATGFSWGDFESVLRSCVFIVGPDVTVLAAGVGVYS